MAGVGHKAFQKHPRIAKAGLGRAFHAVKGGAQGGVILTQAHPDAATPCGAFEHDGIADALGRRQGRLNPVQQPAARQQGHARRRRQVARGVFQAKGADMIGRGADKGDACRSQPFGKADVFGQKAVAGMHSLGPRLAARTQDGLYIQIAFGCWGRA